MTPQGERGRFRMRERAAMRASAGRKRSVEGQGAHRAALTPLAGVAGDRLAASRGPILVGFSVVVPTVMLPSPHPYVFNRV
jgi:hypothetical protein